MELYDMDVGIVGLNSRAIAESAQRAGLDVYLAGYYPDTDLELAEDRVFSMQRNPLGPDLGGEYSAEALVDLAIEKLSGLVDLVIPTSVMGCNVHLLRGLEREFEILGNGSGKVERVKTWKSLEKILRDVGAEFPETVVVDSVDELNSAMERIGFPAVLKSPYEGGGVGQHLLRDIADVENKEWAFESGRELLLQRYVDGIPVSASVLSDGKNSLAISVNRQLIGTGEFNAMKEFTYCGNLVPLDSGMNEKIAELSERIISKAGLLGSVGIDYIMSGDRLYFMEINPRLQDTLECVERYRRINLVEKHMDAINGELETKEFRSGRCFGKGIIFADGGVIIDGLGKAEDVADVPPDGSVIRAHEPVCSVFAEGRGNEEVTDMLKKGAGHVLSTFCSPCID
ncbi:MAG: ATP-grasp domain-containing protein [Candidatus Altiarchaeota archaeon]|nr:ATP-grasp domain-containing protein [Candidatus Altiarchaeota archaeon]